jgi:hypothetical protein
MRVTVFVNCGELYMTPGTIDRCIDMLDRTGLASNSELTTIRKQLEEEKTRERNCWISEIAITLDRYSFSYEVNKA